VWWPTDEELEDEELSLLFGETTQETEVVVPKMPWRDALEANKTRDTCILCGKPTRDTAVLSSVVKTCVCVDDLANKEIL